MISKRISRKYYQNLNEKSESTKLKKNRKLKMNLKDHII